VSMFRFGLPVFSNVIVHLVFTSKYFESRLLSSMRATFDSTNPMEANHRFRLGTIFGKSSFVMVASLTVLRTRKRQHSSA